ncbi:unnamed protein product [Owenia fusiformis]|uniref:Uncharacterized protein n=1 Tax=Owenia fusiformis TaxID=6347 RepID=A0A8J1TUC7_OWEFU|nr:unnamed protein product [Owenia fusiformis]
MNWNQMLQTMSYHLRGAKKNKIHTTEGPDMGAAFRKSGWNAKKPRTEPAHNGPIIWDPKNTLPGSLRVKPKQKLSTKSKKSQSKVKKNGHRKIKSEEVFPFSQLPSNCKLKILSYLGESDRGAAGQVCREWNILIKSSGIWDTINFTTFPLCTNPGKTHECSHECYQKYMTRVKNYMTYLGYIQPAMKKLQFDFDIGDKEDGWLTCLERFLMNCQGDKLLYARMNWKETPVKPFCVDGFAWSSREYNEMVHRHRHRQRDFIQFLELFVNVAPNVKQLMVPFDWSFRSIYLLSKLHQLETLILERYFVFHTLNQNALDELLRVMPKVRKLVLEVWCPSGRGLELYRMSSNSIETLDISQSRGFYLKSVNLPNMVSFRATRHPWNGPLVSPEHINLPCLYKVLVQGAPKLRQFNDLILTEDWRQSSCPKLEELLKTVCSCRNHKQGWSM